jgi:Trk-type K+ transport system membrane component
MMYIAIFPIALSIRSSNTYEEKSLGLWKDEESPNEENGKSYLVTHMKNQLGFDLWYIFLGTFCIIIAESDRVANVDEPVRRQHTLDELTHLIVARPSLSFRFSSR